MQNAHRNREAQRDYARQATINAIALELLDIHGAGALDQIRRLKADLREANERTAVLVELNGAIKSEIEELKAALIDTGRRLQRFLDIERIADRRLEQLNAQVAATARLADLCKQRGETIQKLESKIHGGA